jgi:hypothetical protein
MRPLRYACVELLLFKTFIKALAKQLYMKVTKFTRRTAGTKAFASKLAKTYYFVKDMSLYNLEVVRRSRRGLRRLEAEKVQELSIYGETDVVEVLYDLTFEIPVKIRVVYKNYPTTTSWRLRLMPLGTAATGDEKVIVASLVNCEEIVNRLRNAGVEDKRIILL